MQSDFYHCLCCVCDKPIYIHIDYEEQCDECMAYEGRVDWGYAVDYSNKSKLDKYQLKMIEHFIER